MRNYLQWICFMIDDSNSKAFIIFTFYWCNIIYVWNIVILFKLWWKKFTSTFPFVQVNFNWHYRFSQFMETLTFPLVRIWFTHIDSSHHSQDIQKSEQMHASVIPCQGQGQCHGPDMTCHHELSHIIRPMSHYVMVCRDKNQISRQWSHL